MSMYETMLITSATLDEAANAAVIDKFKNLIEANGTIDAVEDWGKRRLAYPINKEFDGIYTLIHFTSGPEFPAELDRVYKITDGVLRSLIIAKDDVMENARVEAIAKAEASKKAAAKAEADRAQAKAEAEQKAAEQAAAVAEEPAQPEETATAETPEQEASE